MRLPPSLGAGGCASVLEATVLGPPRNRMAELDTAAAIEPVSTGAHHEGVVSLGDHGEPHSSCVDSTAKESNVAPMETNEPDKREGNGMRRTSQHP